MSPGEQARRSAAVGVAWAGVAYLAWGMFPLYFRSLHGVPAPEILSHRILWSVVFVVALVTALRRWRVVLPPLRSAATVRRLAVSAVFISLNWLVYIWAVNAGHVLEASLGYFVNPLVSVGLGVVFLRESITRRQLAAVLIAAAGVVVLVIRAHVFPWVSLALAITFGVYGLIRKRVKVDAMAGLLVEVLVLSPLALAYVTWLHHAGADHFGATPRFTVLLALCGAVTALPLIWFALGVQRLRLSTVGLLQYINPTVQFVIAVLLFGERFTQGHAIAFGCIWASLAIYTWDAIGPGRVAPAVAPPSQPMNQPAAQPLGQPARTPR
jgi:chloramphenicol-sensitive protein RarD